MDASCRYAQPQTRHQRGHVGRSAIEFYRDLLHGRAIAEDRSQLRDIGLRPAAICRRRDTCCGFSSVIHAAPTRGLHIEPRRSISTRINGNSAPPPFRSRALVQYRRGAACGYIVIAGPLSITNAPHRSATALRYPPRLGSQRRDPLGRSLDERVMLRDDGFHPVSPQRTIECDSKPLPDRPGNPRAPRS